jgi:hypothetical protein
MSTKVRQFIFPFLEAYKVLLPRKKFALILGTLFITFVFVSFLFPEAVGAQVVEAAINGAAYVSIWITNAFTKLFLSLTTFFLRFFIQLASYNGFLDAPMVLVGWRLIRDIANMFFVIILLVIAFATILGQENFEWRRTLVKLVLAAIFINFSLLICGLVIDAAHVFTITFLNAIAPVAGGNLIQMFNLDKLTSLVADPTFSTARGFDSNLTFELFIASFFSVLFSFMAMLMIGIYSFMLLARMVYIWVLLILSPVAFVGMVLPQTQSAANEWVSDFTKYVMVAPVMVFFLWLAFATLGSAGEAADVLNHGNTLLAEPELFREVPGPDQQISANAASTWHATASFLIAFAFLFAGLERVQKMGTLGGDLLSTVKKYGAAVATIASGYATGRWLYERGSDGAGIVGGLVSSPIKTAIKTETEAIKARYYNLAGMKKDEIKGIGKLIAPIARNEVARKKRLAKTEKVVKAAYDIAWTRSGSEAGGRVLGVQASNTTGEGILKKWQDVREKPFAPRRLAKALAASVSLPFSMVARATGAGAFAGLSDYEYEMEDVLDDDGKPTGSRRAKMVDVLDAEGNPTGKKEKKKNDLYNINAYDRVQAGIYQAEKERSNAKTAAISGEGYRDTLARYRLKNGVFEDRKGTVAEQIAGHQIHEAAVKAEIERIKRESEAGIKGALVDETSGRKPPTSIAGSHGAINYKEAERQRIADERKAKNAGIAVDRLDEQLERDYNATEEGQAVLGVRMEQEAEKSLAEKEIDRQKEQARQAFFDGDRGAEIISLLNDNEMGIKAAQDFIEGIKKSDLNEKFAEAAKIMADAIGKQGEKTEKDIRAAMGRAAASNPFIEALQREKLTGRVEDMLAASKARADSNASAGFVELPSVGVSSPAAVTAAVAKRVSDDLNSMEAPALARHLASVLANLVAKRSRGEDIDEYTRLYAFGTADKVTAEAYLSDDTAAAIATTLNNIERKTERGEALDVTEEQTQPLREFLKKHGEKYGFSATVDKDGQTKWKAVSNADGSTASLLQALATNGGDLEYVQDHAEIEAGQGENETYWNAAKRILGGESSDRYKNFVQKTEDQEDYYRDAFSQFKRSALAAGHTQNGANFWYDDSTKSYRLATRNEQAALMEAELRKREGVSKAQYQSWGNIDQDTNILTILSERMTRVLAGSIKRSFELRVNDRTRDGLTGYKPSQVAESKDGSGVLGAAFTDENVGPGASKKFVTDILIPMIKSNPNLLSLVSQKKFGNVSAQEAERGILDVYIEGLGRQFDRTSEIIRAITSRKDEFGLDDIEFKKLEQAAEQMAKLENSYQNRGRGGGGDDGAEEEASRPSVA